MNNELKHIESLLEQAESKISENNISEAEKICNHALAHCNKTIQTPELLYRIGFILFQTGNITSAEKIWQESIQDSIEKNDKYYQAFILHNIATIKANSGNIMEATYLWQESLDIKESIDDKKGIAATLNNLAWVSKIENDFEEEKNHLVRSTKIFAELSMWNELVDNLLNLSECDKQNSLFYLLQAFYISTKILIEPKDVLLVITKIIETIGIDNKYSSIFAAMGLLLNNNESEDIFKANQELLIAIALSKNIKEDEIGKWIIKNNLNDSNYLINSISEAFEKLNTNDEWYFQPEQLL